MLSTSGSVPKEFEEVSASDIEIPEAIQTAGIAATQRPLKMMLVGDSMAKSLGWGFERAAIHGYQFFNAAVDGCGLAQDVGERWFARWIKDDPRCVPGWRERWPAAINGYAPDLIVALFGAQDVYDRKIDGREIPFDSAEGQALAEQELQQAIDILTAGGAHLVLLTTPFYVAGWPMKIQADRSAFNDSWITRYNTIQNAVASRNPDKVSIIDLNRYINPSGRYQKTVNGIEIRTFDNVHLSTEGAEFVIRWLHPQLEYLGRRHLGVMPEPVSTGVVRRS